MSQEPLVSHVSDTARWVAVHRAAESVRADALFDDPYADRLAGARGRAISALAERGTSDGWFLVSRTKLIDDHVATAISEGCDAVINLGAGLDARPYRMDLPADLLWVEADFAGLIDEKSALLADAVPRCRLIRKAVDLTDADAVASFLDDVLAGVGKALVLSEGLVMYLTDDEVSTLCGTLARPEIAWWALDFSTAGVAALVVERNEGVLREAPWTFLPADGVAYFENRGWSVVDLESIFTAAGRFDRLPAQARPALDGPQPDPRAPGQFPYSGVVRLAAPGR